MLLRLNHIEFILENCEVIKIEKENIRSICLDQISTSMYSIPTNIHGNIYKRNECNDFYIDILPYNNLYYSCSLWDHLKIKNITSIDLIFDDQSIESYYFPWIGNNYTNYCIDIQNKETFTRLSINNKFSIRKFLYKIKRRLNMNYT